MKGEQSITDQDKAGEELQTTSVTHRETVGRPHTGKLYSQN